MADFKVAIAHDNPGGLVALDPQPSWPAGGKFGKIAYGLDSSLGLQAQYYDLMLSPGLDQTLWFSLLTQCGLSIDPPIVYAAYVTIQVPLEQFGGTKNYNATARYNGDGSRHFLIWKSYISFVGLKAL